MSLDPRVARSRAAVLRSATELLLRGGPTAVTVDAVVADSGVAKTTIYRQWPSRDDLLVAVFESMIPDVPPAHSELPFEEALRATLRDTAVITRNVDWRRTLPSLMQLKNHEPAIANIEQELRQRQSAVLVELLDRGVEESRVRPGFDPQRALALLVGPLLFAALTDLDVDDGFVDDIVDRYLAGESQRLAVAPAPVAR
jgi:TetR/AcrR family transcriptional regulator of autoinduction and epiphytic fitness